MITEMGDPGTIPILEFLRSYPYLLMSLSLFSLCVVFMAVFREYRKPMIISGFLSVPCALYAVAFVPEYWHPNQVFRLFVGPEDILFSFATGALVWLMVAYSARGSWLQIDIRPGRLARRYGAIATIFLALMLAAWFAGLRPMDAYFVSAAALFALLLIVRPHLWPVAARGSALFAGFYLAFIWLIITFIPEFLQQWNQVQLYGIEVGGVPLEEVLWATMFGAVWPLGMTYFFEARPAGIIPHTAASRLS